MEEQPKIEIINLEKNSDGKTADLTFNTNKAFDEMAKKTLGVEELTQPLLSEFVMEMLNKAALNMDGYSFAPEE